MVDELAGKTIGQRIQILRERRGKSRAVVAGLVGRSEEWLKAVEKGRLQPPRLDMLVRIAEVLGIQDLQQLTGQQDIPLGLVRRAAHDAVPAIREATEEIPLVVPTDPQPDAEDLRRRVRDAWRTWHASPAPREALAGVLPELIRECQRAVRVLDGRDRRAAYAALSEVYALCEQVLAWVSDAPLVWLVADRGMLAAQQADDPLVLAGAAWVMGNVQRATGREEEALALVDEAASLLEPRLADGSDAERAMWGGAAVARRDHLGAARPGGRRVAVLGPGGADGAVPPGRVRAPVDGVRDRECRRGGGVGPR